MRKLKSALAILTLALLVSGCSQTTPALIETGLLCKHWPVIRPTPGEITSLSDQTKTDILKSNEARPEYGCKKLSNEAA